MAHSELPNQEDQISELTDQAVLENTKKTFENGFRFAPWVYLAFSIPDYFYAPSCWLQFFFARVGHWLFLKQLQRFSLKHQFSLKTFQRIGLLWSAVAAWPIIYMMAVTQGMTSPYNAGLNLVGSLAIFFIPFHWPTIIAALAIIYLPYFVIGLKQLINSPQFSIDLILNSGFIIASSIFFCG